MTGRDKQETGQHNTRALLHNTTGALLSPPPQPTSRRCGQLPVSWS